MDKKISDFTHVQPRESSLTLDEIINKASSADLIQYPEAEAWLSLAQEIKKIKEHLSIK